MLICPTAQFVVNWATNVEPLMDSLVRAFGGQVTALGHTSVVMINRDADDTASAFELVWGPLSSNPWGLSEPRCEKEQCKGRRMFLDTIPPDDMVPEVSWACDICKCKRDVQRPQGIVTLSTQFPYLNFHYILPYHVA